ncbi:MAG TPA: amino acid adenylation domain-containing protein, partial [Puia sp.]|nr:amino acid adenylation domain-containing protein [Puia sp.]
REAIAGMPHHYTQLAQVQAQTPLGRNLFDHIFQFQNFPIQERIEKDLGTADASGKVSFLSTGAMGHNTYDLTLIVIPGDSMIFNFKYNGNVYEETLIRQLGAHLIQLINTILEHPEITVGELGLLSMEEQRGLLEQFSPGGGDYPADQTVVRLFDKQAGLSPEAPAVLSGGRLLTYRELKEQAGALAGYLHSVAGVNPGDRVGILLDRSEYWIISLMAVLKAGAAYVPIDTGHPASRKEFIVKDTDIKALITTTDYLFDVPGYAGTTVAIDIQLDEIVGAYTTPMVDIGPETIAYIIYTSGSTGQPKGVMISHRSLVDYVAGIRARTNIDSCRSFGLVSSPVADLGNTVLYTALLTGGVLHVFSAEEAMNGHRLAAADLDCIKIVPSHWKALQEGPNLFLPRHCLIFGGEQLNGELLSMIRTAGAHCEVYNHYGPTETTIGKLLTRVDTLDTGAVIPIGKPFCRSWVYITDNKGRLCPVGVTGEIRIGGDGVAQGYWNNHALTADRFLADPYRGTGTLYLTGDRGRWLPDGNVEFLGRIDDQVKIRGYRVEPGEVARKIMAIEGVSSAVVIAMPGAGGEKELAAYVVSEHEIEESTFQEYLGRELPSYMWPVYYIRIASIPLTANGKVDRRRLPALDRQKDLSDEAYKAPRTETERRLSEIWSDVLGKERIGVTDNFFSLGGHSLKATRLASQLHRVFGVRVEFHELFNHTILEEQALLIDRTRQDQFSGIPLAPPMNDYPLSSSQRRLWLLSQTEESNIAYNVPGLFVFEGELQVQALEQAFQGLINRHEILRTAFRENASGEVRQIILSMEETGFRIDGIDLRMEDEKEAAVRRKVQQEMVRPFDLAAGCLLRVMLLQVDTDKWVFFYNLHHIISDGWSKSVVLNELLQFYNALAKNDPLSLRPLPIQYKDYAVWQQQQLSG